MKLVIYGAGGLGREMLALLRASDPGGQWNFIGFVDDGKRPGTRVGDAGVLGGLDWFLSEEEPVAVVMGLADPSAKASLYEKLSGLPNARIKFPVMIHPLAHVEPSASFAQGTVIFPFCFIAVEASMGVCSFLNTASYLGHDSIVGDFCSVMPNANISGNVTIRSGTFVGSGANILQGLKIGSDATVGMGSVVLRDVPDGCTVVGNPAQAKKIDKTRKGVL